MGVRKLPWRQVVVAAAFALAGCTNPVEQHGNLPEADKLAQIKPGSTDKATVTRLIGSPSTVAAFDANTWYYVSQKTRNQVLHPPTVVDQQVVAIDFDDKGVVVDVQHRALADAAEISPNPNATPAPGREFTFLEQLIGNFGKFTGNGKEGPGTSGGH